VLVALACWLGTQDRRGAAGGVPVTVADSATPPAPAPEPPAATSPPEDRTADAPPVADPPAPPVPPPPPPAAPAPAKEKPEGARPPAEAPKPPAPAQSFPRRLSDRTEDDLRNQLLAAPEFGVPLAVRQAMVRAYRTRYRTDATVTAAVTFDPFTLLQHFPPAAELPVRSGANCQLGAKEGATLGVLARKLHAYLDLIAPKDANGERTRPTQLREVLRQERRGNKRPEWLRPEAVPAMLQILMAEAVPLRLILVDLLAEIPARPAAVALAQRAVFDLSPEVRRAALAALRDRPPAESRAVFLDALRYPWAAAADHAAEALVELEDREAAPLLVPLLDKPDPLAPYAARGGLTVRQVVRVNHVANCLLCHAPAVGGEDPVVGVDPFVNVPPPQTGGGRWGGGRSGGGGGGGGGGQLPAGWAGSRSSLLVRADVQFLKQDFSVSYAAGVPGVAVQGVRFDFLVRTRPLTAAEARAWKQQPRTDLPASRHREAALFALRGLTGKDLGPATAAWRELFPHADALAEGRRLSDALVRASPEQREQLLVRYRDAKGDRYTEGLAYAVPQLTGKLQTQAREALVERLARLPAELLRERLEDDDAELRRAAARACVRKADPELVPDLIGLLQGPEPDVAAGARAVLQRLTGKEFGPPADRGSE
jgi:HEAT repeat protein